MKINNSELYEIIEFQKEKDKFCPIMLMSKDVQCSFDSDLENYIIGRKYPGATIIIWTIDNISKDKVIEINKILNKDYLGNGKNTIICKKDLYKKLHGKLSLSNYSELGFMKCKNLSQIQYDRLLFIKANYGDKIALSEYWIDYCKEMFNSDISFNDSMLEVETWLEEDNFYVMRDYKNKIVAMAKYSIADNIAEITHVFTPKDERGKGYCKALVYNITEKLMEDNLTPVLFTDYHYESSNAAYKKVGYVLEDNLARFNAEKEIEIL